MLDVSARTPENPQRCLHRASLQRFFEESQKINNGRILNILDLPTGTNDRNILQYKSF